MAPKKSKSKKRVSKKGTNRELAITHTTKALSALKRRRVTEAREALREALGFCELGMTGGGIEPEKTREKTEDAELRLSDYAGDDRYASDPVAGGDGHEPEEGEDIEEPSEELVETLRVT